MTDAVTPLPAPTEPVQLDLPLTWPSEPRKVLPLRRRGVDLHRHHEDVRRIYYRFVAPWVRRAGLDPAVREAVRRLLGGQTRREVGRALRKAGATRERAREVVGEAEEVVRGVVGGA